MRQRRSKTKNVRKISYYTVKTVILTLKNHKKLNLKFKIKKKRK